MSFSAEWLALREPADARARDAALLAAAGAALARRSAPLVVDLGCGRGANFRALGPHLPADARLRLVDADAELLAQAEAAAPGAQALRLDLAQALEAAVAGADLVTASALIDLCSAAWIDRLMAAAPARAVVYIALSVDGDERWSPATEDDRLVHRAFLSHQARDKGFGPALGPSAATHLAAAALGAGRVVRTARSPWRLERGRDDGLIEALADGVAVAAREAGAAAAAVSRWRAAPRERVVVGHVDVLATPRG